MSKLRPPSPGAPAMTIRERIAAAALEARCEAFLDGECDGPDGCDACLAAIADNVSEKFATWLDERAAGHNTAKRNTGAAARKRGAHWRDECRAIAAELRGGGK